MTRYYGDIKPRIRPEDEWLRISSEMTWAVEDLAGHDGFMVQIAPDGGFDDTAYENGKLREDAKQNPGITFPRLGVIEINGKYMPEDVDLEDVHPLAYNDFAKYPTVAGLLVHEASHANHTRWLLKMAGRELTEEEGHHLGAAHILEESREEHRHLQFRPQDQPWLQAAATDITLRELEEGLSQPAPDGGINKPAVARMAALTLGRIDAGSIDPTEVTDKLEAMAREVFEGDFDKMRGIWREAQETGDEDADAMLALGKRWYELTGDDGGQGQEGQESKAGREAQAMLDELGKLARHAKGEATGENERKRSRERIEKVARDTRKESAAQKDAKEEAAKVFHAAPVKGSRAGRGSPVTGYRDPTGEEMGLARRTRRGLLNAMTPERAVTKLGSAAPPGRLSMRDAQRRSIQRSLGVMPTAEPFTRKERKRIPVPPLKVGIIQDVSGSQSAAAAATASGAWALAKATEGIMDAQVAMVTFGDTVHAVFGPRDKLPRVPVLQTPSGSHHLHEALVAIEGVLDLMKAGSARLVVVLTDGVHEHDQILMRDPDLKRLRDAGVKILWFVTDGNKDSYRRYLPGTRGIHVHDKARGQYDIIPQVINQEAVNALKVS